MCFWDWDGRLVPLHINSWHGCITSSLSLFKPLIESRLKVGKVAKKKSNDRQSEDEDKMKVDEDPREDVIATIHVLKNKTQVKKRVVTRHAKGTEEA